MEVGKREREREREIATDLSDPFSPSLQAETAATL